ncbi:hypothetical protein [Pararhizobium sp. LjRoot238]|uniref:hypothetical protein n=1 Tax=Pararhizobium sp. LjRoot238 TaxID=3342293 RepID=UPI003ED0CBAD
MNSNLFHNILNVIIALLGFVTAILLATGCTTLSGGEIECSKSVVDPTYTTIAIAVLGTLKTVINILRDGLMGLIKPQPPIR